MLIAKTIETTGFVNEHHQLWLDESLPIAEFSKVRVIVLVSEETQLNKHKYISKRNCKKIDTLQGSFKNCLSSSSNFAKRKTEEIKLEEVKWQRK